MVADWHIALNITDLAMSKPVPIMLEILSIILSRISQKFCPLFFCPLPIILIKFFRLYCMQVIL